MSSETKVKKRKSVDAVETAAKKVKIAKSADRPTPVKSALKKAINSEEIPASKEAKKEKKEKRAEKPKKDEKPKKEEKPKQTKAEPTPPIPSQDAEDEEVVAEDGTDLTPDQTAALLAGFSSSDEDEDDETDGVPLSFIPNAPSTGAIQERVSEAVALIAAQDSTQDPEKTPGVIYVGRIPHGFYEHQMRAYFGQFGDITHLRLARSKKTRQSRHYAFLEFASSSVADIVAKTMDKYLLFNHILQVRRVPAEQIKENMWAGEGRRKRAMPRNRIEGTKLRKGTDREGWQKRITKEDERRKKKAEQLKELGYEFDMPKLKNVEVVPEKPKAVDVEKEAEGQLLREVQEEAKHGEAEAITAETIAQPATSEDKAKKRAAKSQSNGVKTKKAKAKA